MSAEKMQVIHRITGLMEQMRTAINGNASRRSLSNLKAEFFLAFRDIALDDCPLGILVRDARVKSKPDDPLPEMEIEVYYGILQSLLGEVKRGQYKIPTKPEVLPVADDREMMRHLLQLKDRVAKHFSESNWRDLGALTGELDLIEDHGRLLRSLSFGDDDYEGHVFPVLKAIVKRDSANLDVIESYLQDKYPEDDDAVSISSHPAAGPRIVFAPDVFKVPAEPVDRELVSLMMPFESSFRAVYEAIKGAVGDAGMQCQRADDIWVHTAVIQDVFSLIYRSYIVVCDFTGKNPNVFYEAGIAHTLGKHVVPITQNKDHIPFDLQHHRYLPYLNNTEGLQNMRSELAKRLKTLTER